MLSSSLVKNTSHTTWGWISASVVTGNVIFSKQLKLSVLKISDLQNEYNSFCISFQLAISAYYVAS